MLFVLAIFFALLNFAFFIFTSTFIFVLAFSAFIFSIFTIFISVFFVLICVWICWRLRGLSRFTLFIACALINIISIHPVLICGSALALFVVYSLARRILVDFFNRTHVLAPDPATLEAHEHTVINKSGNTSYQRLLRPATPLDPINDAVQEYKYLFHTRELIPHPVQGMLAGYGHLLQEDSRVVVPQVQFKCGNTVKDWEPKPTIYFFTSDRLGVKLSDVLHGNFKGMNDRDDSPFGEECRGITIRIHFPGYESSTNVEKKLKLLAEGRPWAKARSMQLSTKNYKVPPEPITKSKLAQEVSKRIKWHITDLETNSALFQFDDQYDQQWRLGQGRMNFERLVITGLVNVSSGSWSPIICVE